MKISAVLRRVDGGHSHWCPACEEMHIIPDGWSFDGNVEAPTFAPSVKITGKQTVKINGKWSGEWVRGADGVALDLCCHYLVKAGQIEFCGDCTHALAGQAIPLPPLPDGPADQKDT